MGSATSHHLATHRIIIIPLHHNSKPQNQHHTVKMQFTTIIAPFLALAAAASAQYNGTAPSGTAMGTASASGAGTGSNPTTSPSTTAPTTSPAPLSASSLLAVSLLPCKDADQRF